MTESNPLPFRARAIGPDELKALAHPLRMAMYDYLSEHGSATASQLGRHLGESSGQTSYHLRQLEKHGFIEEIPERSTGRERWWRRTESPRDIRMPAPETLAPQDRPALEEVLRLGHAEDMDLLSRLLEAYKEDPAWSRLSRGFAHMTEQGLAEFFEAHIRLLHQHRLDPERLPPDARPVYIRLFALPADEE